jgi:hypothetical protein
MKKGIDQEIFKILINSNPKRSPDGQVREIKQIFKELFLEIVGKDIEPRYTLMGHRTMDTIDSHINDRLREIRQGIKDKLK